MDEKSKCKFLKVHLRSRWRILFDNFLGGIAWGVGSVIGATIVIGIISFIFVKTQSVPIIGDFITSIITELQESRSQTHDVFNGE